MTPILSDQIRRHPITAFFILAFSISWIIWTLSAVAGVKNFTYLMLIGVIGAFGPAAAAIAISAILHPEQSGISARKRWGYCAVLFCLILPFAVFWPSLKGSPADPVFVVLCAILSFLSAFVISGMFGRIKGVRDLMAPLGKWRIHPALFVIALCAWPILVISSSILDLLCSGQPLYSYSLGLSAIEPVSALVLFATIFLLGGPLQEEPGWRGFALPRLQCLYNPIVASIILGFLWQLWHVPLYFTGFYAFDTTALLIRLVDFIPGVIIVTWLYNRAGGSLLIVVLFHASMDAFPQILPAQTGWAPRIFDLLLLVWAVIVIFTDRMWRRLPAPPDHPDKEPGA